MSALRLASCAAAIAVTKKGAAPSIPKREEAEMSLTGFILESAEEGDAEMLSLIDEYLCREYKTATVTGLAEYLSLSNAKTEGLIKRIKGQTFSSLLSDKRCAIAAEMLLDTDQPISRISEAVGFETEEQFKKMFRERYGRAPTIFRRLARCPK